MVPPVSGRVSRAPPYSGCCQPPYQVPTGLSPAGGGLSSPLRSPDGRHAAVLQPRDRSRFGLLPVRSPLLGESRLMSSPPATWMFRFAGLAPRGLCVRPRGARVAPGGLSHSDPRESMASCASSRIFAACRVLRRRRMPRHPPCALSRLIPRSSDIALASHERLGPRLLDALARNCFASRLFLFSGIASRTVKWLTNSKIDYSKTYCFKEYGAKETRTPNIQLAKLALYQLSYNPTLFSEWA